MEIKDLKEMLITNYLDAVALLIWLCLIGGYLSMMLAITLHQ